MATDRLTGVETGLGMKAPVLVATTASITLSGLQTIDGVALADGDRVLVKDQSTSSQNGIYTATTSTWSRAVDFDGIRDAKFGTLVPVAGGSTNARSIWQLTTTGDVDFGTDAITFTMLSPLTASAYWQTMLALTTAGAALTQLGVSAYIQTLLDDASAAAALATLGAGISDLSEDTSVAWLTDWLLAETSGGVRKVSPADINSEKPCFRAHKSGTDQTGILTGADTQVTYGTESFDIGSCYSTATSRWTPPAGYVRVKATAEVTGGVVDQAKGAIMIFKNGSSLARETRSFSGTTSMSVAVDVIDSCDGDDYYEVWVNLEGAGNKTIGGLTTRTLFMGAMI